MNMGGADLRLKFSGDSLGDLYDLTGVLLPDTPPFETDGRLVAKLTRKNPLFLIIAISMAALATAIFTERWPTPPVSRDPC